MMKVGFDKIEVDPMGNLLGYIGTGNHLIAMGAHVDTVAPGNIPCIGFGPGRIEEAHSTDEKVPKKDLAEAAAMYAVIPSLYIDQYAEKSF